MASKLTHANYSFDCSVWYISLLQEALSFSFNFTGVERALVDRVLVRVAAKNNFSQGPFSESVYLGKFVMSA